MPVFQRQGKLWDAALNNMPLVNELRHNILAEIFRCTMLDISRMHLGSTETPAAMMPLLRMLAGPHGTVLLTLKLRELGYRRSSVGKWLKNE